MPRPWKSRQGGSETFLKWRYKRRRHWLDKYKTTQRCCECGYNAHPAALDFDHIDPSTKEFTIPQYVERANLKRLMGEVRKCRVICANCHRIHSREQWKAGITNTKKRGQSKNALALRQQPNVPQQVRRGHISPEVCT
jgi:hypothetical protein